MKKILKIIQKDMNEFFDEAHKNFFIGFTFGSFGTLLTVILYYCI